MSNEPTPWEDINPPMASAQPQGQPSACSDPRTVFRNELAACLTLVAPVGMDETARRDWFAVAWDTLKHIPPNILAIGARKARGKCDHPSKIVPTILAETAEMMRWKRESEDESHLLPAPEKRRCQPEEAREILKRLGIRPSW
jgi:hypothetical protein